MGSFFFIDIPPILFFFFLFFILINIMRLITLLLNLIHLTQVISGQLYPNRITLFLTLDSLSLVVTHYFEIYVLHKYTKH